MSRLAYYARKANRALRDGTLVEKSARWARNAIVVSSATALRQALRPPDVTSAQLDEGFADHRNDPRHVRSNPAVLERIAAAFRAAKADQASAASEFRVRGLWSEWIDINYRVITAAASDQSTHRLGALLENYNRESWLVATGGSGYDQFLRYRSGYLGRAYCKQLWASFRDMFVAAGGRVGDVEWPWVGNPCGIPCNASILQPSAFRYAHYAREFLSLLGEGGVVVEIGGGVGGQAFQAIRLAKTRKYVIYDLPEVCITSSYFLAHAYPDLRIRFYGEGSTSVADSESYDIAVFPHFSIGLEGLIGASLIHNSCSFSEMDGTCASAYLSLVEKSRPMWFHHINHNNRFRFREEGGGESVNRLANEMAPKGYNLEREWPRKFMLPEDRGWNYAEYLYRRQGDSQEATAKTAGSQA